LPVRRNRCLICACLCHGKCPGVQSNFMKSSRERETCLCSLEPFQRRRGQVRGFGSGVRETAATSSHNMRQGRSRDRDAIFSREVPLFGRGVPGSPPVPDQPVLWVFKPMRSTHAFNPCVQPMRSAHAFSPCVQPMRSAATPSRGWFPGSTGQGRQHQGRQAR